MTSQQHEIEALKVSDRASGMVHLPAVPTHSASTPVSLPSLPRHSLLPKPTSALPLMTITAKEMQIPYVPDDGVPNADVSGYPCSKELVVYSQCLHGMN